MPGLPGGGTVLGLAAVLALSAATPPAAAGVAGEDGGDTGGRRSVSVEPPRTVTLVTGDRVTVRPDDQGQPVSVQPAPGREHVRFSATRVDGHLEVIPSDLSVLVGTGRLDRRLFDVSLLLDSGYDDRSRSDLPLIVSYRGATAARSAAGRAGLAATGARVTRDLPSVTGVAVRERKTDAGRFWAAVAGTQAGARVSTTPPVLRDLAPGVARIGLDGRLRATLDRSVPQIGAPEAWRAGYTGAGVTVAVLDTGIDATHPDLADAVADAHDFTGSPSGAADVNGHGTHVAGIITGNGAASDGRYVGVAPDARLLVGKVLGDDGYGLESDAVAGMEWAAQNGADVVNMSLGGEHPSDGTDFVSEAVNRLTAESGTLFVIAAGNTGPTPQTVTSPGAADAALTVGAVDSNEALAFFSSRGPRLRDGGLKPEITAPGFGIISARAGGGQSAQPYTVMSGTSQATPHVVGVAALLAQRHPDWQATDLKAALVGSAARPNPTLTVYEQGAGRVDAARATSQDVYATPATVHVPVREVPLDDDPPATTTVTYHNAGDQPLDLALALDVRGPAGEPAPEGMFTVSAGQLTVPAHGTASVDVVTDTRTATVLGSYGGTLIATGGTVSVVTPVGVTLEPESYDLTVEVADAAGAPNDAYELQFVNLDDGRGYAPYDPSGRVRAHLPKGRYYLLATQYTPDGGTVVRAEPELVLDHDQTLTVDARDSVPVGIEVDHPEARTGDYLVGVLRDVGAGLSFKFLMGTDLDGVRAVPSASSTADEDFWMFVEGHLARPDGAGGFHNSPYLYHVRWYQHGRVPDHMVRRFHDSDFGVVRSEIGATAPGQTALLTRVVTVPTPATVTEYYLPGITWFPVVWILTDTTPGALPDSSQVGIPRTVQKGSRQVERWNVGVFGPAFPQGPNYQPAYSAFVTPTLMRIQVPLFSDQGAEHDGFTARGTGHTTVYRDGVQVGSTPIPGFGFFDVAPDEARYEVVTESTQDGSELSTSVRARWTFRAAGPAEGEELALPMSAVRFAPALDQHNRAPGDRVFPVPVRVEHQPGAASGGSETLTVEASFDDGRTWHGVRVVAGRALVEHPRGASYVSLRATVTDSAGNSLEQTVIRAYALAPTA